MKFKYALRKPELVLSLTIQIIRSASTTIRNLSYYLNATPQKYGYTRYFKMGTKGVSLNVRFDFWEKIADTPFWLCVKDDITDVKNWKQTEAFKAQMKNTASRNSIIPYESNKRELFIPVRPLTDKTEDLVINDMANQIVKLTKELE